MFFIAVKSDKGGATLWGPHRLAGLTDIKVRSVISSCTAAHCVVIATDGTVYTWGQYIEEHISFCFKQLT